MLPTKDLFFGRPEPVWILKAEKDHKKNGDDEEASSKTTEISIHASIPYDTYYNHHYSRIPAKKGDHGKDGRDKREETTVLVKVPMCCGECETSVRIALEELKGVKSVECNWFKERVTAVATSAAPADILMECKKHFKTSRMWRDDD